MASKKKKAPAKETRRKAPSKLPAPKKGAPKRPRGRPSKTFLKRSAASRRGWETRRLNETLYELERTRSPKRRAELSEKLVSMLDEENARWQELFSRDLLNRATGESGEGEVGQNFDFFFKTALPAMHEGGALGKRTEKMLKPYLGGEVQILIRGKVQGIFSNRVEQSTFELSRIVPIESYDDATRAMGAMVRDYVKEHGASRKSYNDSPFVYLVEYVAFLPAY